MTDTLLDSVVDILAPSIAALGYDLVRVSLTGGQRRRLQVMVERVDRVEMTVEDCAVVSRGVSALLDVSDPIMGAYNLEVSSPGIDRPLVRLSDFDRFSGFEAKVELFRPVEGRKRMRGTVLGVGVDDCVMIGVEGVGLSIPHADIRTAKLVLTDELIAATRSRKL